LKGAARIVDLADGVRVAHAMEDCFVAAQHGRLVLDRDHIDILLSATDLMARIAGTGRRAPRRGSARKKVEACLTALARVLATPETLRRQTTAACRLSPGEGDRPVRARRRQSGSRPARDGRNILTACLV